MQIRRRALKNTKIKSVSRRLLHLHKGVGLFKLATGLVVVASVLFLVPGLRLLVPGLEDIGTTKSQAMPAKNPNQNAEPEKSPAQANGQQHQLLSSCTDNADIIGCFGDNGAIDLPDTVQPVQPASGIIDVDNWLLDSVVSPDAFEKMDLYEQPF